MKLREAQAATLGLFDGEQTNAKWCQHKRDYLKDYLFIAILISFLCTSYQAILEYQPVKLLDSI
jgi:hypothetical protein